MVSIYFAYFDCLAFFGDAVQIFYKKLFANIHSLDIILTTAGERSTVATGQN